MSLKMCMKKKGKSKKQIPRLRCGMTNEERRSSSQISGTGGKRCWAFLSATILTKDNKSIWQRLIMTPMRTSL